jgi:3',5'-cyclic AMP phosphodiesterase CpdA
MSNSATATLLHVSDTHLAHGTEAGVRAASQLSKILEQHRDLPVLLSGDLTSHGDEHSYREIAEILEGRDWIACPGNHDNVARMSADLPARTRLRTAAFEVIAIDSTAPSLVAGRFGDGVLEELEKILASGEGPYLIALHHPPASFATQTVASILLEEASGLGLAAVLERHRGRVLALLCGHLHQSMMGTWGGVPVLSAPSSAYAMHLFDGEMHQAETEGAYMLHRVASGVLCSAVLEVHEWRPTEETLRRRRERV